MYRDDADVRELGERLKQARLACHLTQEQVAAVTKISQSAISLYELGRRDPFVVTAKRLAVAYGVTLDWLMGISEVGGPDWNEPRGVEQVLEDLLRHGLVDDDEDGANAIEG